MKRSRAPSALHSRKVQKTDLSTTISSAPTTTVVKRTQKKFTPPAIKKQVVTPKPVISTNSSTEEEDIFLVYQVYWTKRSNKKHKTFADGIMITLFQFTKLLFYESNIII